MKSYSCQEETVQDVPGLFLAILAIAESHTKVNKSLVMNNITYKLSRFHKTFRDMFATTLHLVYTFHFFLTC